jgi:hypothetical protein
VSVYAFALDTNVPRLSSVVRRRSQNSAPPVPDSEERHYNGEWRVYNGRRILSARSETCLKTPARFYLVLAVFTAGMTTLAVELGASRLLGNVFGTSNLVWANIIGLILLYLTAGYFIGGRWADRSPHPRTFYSLLTWAAFTAGLVPLAARPVLLLAARAVQDFNAAVMGGSFVSVTQGRWRGSCTPSPPWARWSARSCPPCG